MTDLHTSLAPLVTAAFNDRSLLRDTAHEQAVLRSIDALDRGEIRVAERLRDGEWTTHAWIKQAILLYFAVRSLEVTEAGPLEFRDKLPTKHGLEAAGVRVVPPGTARQGSFLEPGVLRMPW